MSSPALLQIIAKIAPSMAAVAAGPFAPIVGPALSTALGLVVHSDDPKTDPLTVLQQKVEQGALTADDIVKLKQAEIDFNQHLADNKLKLAELSVQDVESARAREVAVRDRIPGILAFAMIGGFFAISTLILVGIIFFPDLIGRIPGRAWALIGGILMYLFDEAGAATSYYFGSSQGSSEKNSVLAEAMQQISKAPARS